MTTLKAIQDSLPEFAKDIKLNLSNLENDIYLSKQQLWGTLLACALATKNKVLANAISNSAEEYLSPESINAARIAATLMAMNNVYYRFVHTASNKEYSQIPTNLRMSMMMAHGIDKIDFELFALAISTMNGCGFCVDSHEKLLISKGVDKVVIQTAVRVAAVVSALAIVVN